MVTMKSRTTLESRRLYRARNPEAVKESDRKYRAANKDKVAARSAVNYQLRAGHMVRPDECQLCGAEARVEAHHTDYKNKLNIWWLCKTCHESQ